MKVFYGFIMFFICHTLINIFNNNIYCYIKENKCKEKNQYALKKYMLKTIFTFVIYLALICIALSIKTFSKYSSAILFGNGIGFITGSIHFMYMANENYNKQKAKNDWDSWNYMSFEEKRKSLQNKNESKKIKGNILQKGIFYDISNFIEENFLKGRLREIEIEVKDIPFSRYDKTTNNIYISEKDNEIESSLNDAIIRCFQQATCVEYGILYSSTEIGRNDREISDDDLFDNLDENVKDFTKRINQYENDKHDSIE